MEPAYEDQMRLAKDQVKELMLKGNFADFPDVDESYWSKNGQGEAYFTEPSFDYEDGDVSSRRLKIGRGHPDSRLKTPQTSQHQMVDRIFRPKKRTKLLQENVKGSLMLNGESGMVPFNGEKTESDSSDQQEEDNRPLIMTKLSIHGRSENSRSFSRSVSDRKERRSKKDAKGSALTFDAMLPVSSTTGDVGRHVQMPGIKTLSSKNRHKANWQHPDILQNFPSENPEDGYYSGFVNRNTESIRKSTNRLGRNGQLQAQLAGSFPFSMNKVSPVDRRQKGNGGHDFPSHQSNYTEEDGGLPEIDAVGEGAWNLDTTLTGGSKEIDGQDGFAYMQSDQQIFESVSLRRPVKKTRGRQWLPECWLLRASHCRGWMADLELELKPQKKSFTLIVPTIRTDFSFSITHLLSAVRIALTTPNTEDSLEVGKHNGKLWYWRRGWERKS